MKSAIFQTQRLYIEAKKIIPGGTQLLSKRPEMYAPDLWPAYYKRAKGCHIWDLDNNKYIDMSSMGIGSCILGYADPDVNRAVKNVINKGSMTTLNCYEEVELAKLLCELHPWADMARFARCGGEAMMVAVRIARAKTRKDKILFCGYHGWHDWYLAANLADNRSLDGHLLAGLNPWGVPRSLLGTAIPFDFNDTAGFQKLFKKNKGEIGAVVLEPIRNYYPNKEFINEIQKSCKKAKIPLIIDEVSSGWRLNLGGAHLIFNLEPDIAVFAKAMGNGFPIAAIIGNKNVMQAAADSFISSTNWTERIGPTAALATIDKMKLLHVQKTINNNGSEIKNGWTILAKKHRIKIHVTGFPALLHFDFDCNDKLVLKTLFTQLMLEKGYLAQNGYYASFAHKKEDVKKYLSAVDLVFKDIQTIIQSGTAASFLKGKVCHSGFQRLN